MGISEVEVLNEGFLHESCRSQYTDRTVKLVKGECNEIKMTLQQCYYIRLDLERIDQFTISIRKNFSSMFKLDYFGFESGIE